MSPPTFDENLCVEAKSLATGADAHEVHGDVGAYVTIFEMAKPLKNGDGSWRWDRPFGGRSVQEAAEHYERKLRAYVARRRQEKYLQQLADKEREDLDTYNGGF